MQIVAVIIVFVLCILAVGNVALARWVERRNPPVGRFIDVDGVRLHYLESGPPDAPPVVLFHGNGAMIQDLAGAGLIPLLAQRYRVIAFDRPGFGHSTRPRFRLMTPDAQAALFQAALDRLGVRNNPIVFGHSWGTLVALALAYRLRRAGQPARGLVLAAGYYFPTWRLDVWLMAVPAIPLFGDILRYTILPVLGWMLAGKTIAQLFAPAAVPTAFKTMFPMGMALRPSALRATAEESLLMVPGAARLQKRYHEVSCPIVIYNAALDSLIEAEQAPRLNQVMTASVLHTVGGMGHMLHYAVPEKIVEAVDAVSARQPSASS
ncbi:MAG: alpha/beta hydrolase [Xanthobacteraceae bacterium]